MNLFLQIAQILSFRGSEATVGIDQIATRERTRNDKRFLTE